MAFACSVAQADDVLLDDFENGDKGWQPVDAGWVNFEIVNNPAPDVINSSAKVMKIVRNAGTQTWAGIILRNSMTLAFGAYEGQYRYAHVKMLKNSTGSVTFKLENNGDAGSVSNTQNYPANANWVDVTFDLGSAAGRTFDDFFIMPDQTENIANGITVYIDDIEFAPDPNPTSTDEVELPGTFQLVWADEFNAATYDNTIWSPQISGGGFGNHELQYYTGTANNIFTRDGNLVLKAIKENYQNHAYTSGKLWSQNLKYFKYGRVEARFKLPQGRGTWPAIWMMPQNSVYGGWPNSGEIDIMEYVGYDANKIYGTVHRGAGSGSNGDGSNITVPNLGDDYHIIRIDWEPGYIKWYLDNQTQPFHTYNNANVGSAQWPFDQNFYVILNFAVGGDWGGAQGVDANIWPQEFLIDYVRVYQKSEGSAVKNTPKSKISIHSPEKNKLEVTSETFPFMLNIYSVSGEILLTQSITNAKTMIDISDLSEGMYLVSVNNGQNLAYTQKIVK
jgi:beta-glucanase (GH16 family)